MQDCHERHTSLARLADPWHRRRVVTSTVNTYCMNLLPIEISTQAVRSAVAAVICHGAGGTNQGRLKTAKQYRLISPLYLTRTQLKGNVW